MIFKEIFFFPFKGKRQTVKDEQDGANFDCFRNFVCYFACFLTIGIDNV